MVQLQVGDTIGHSQIEALIASSMISDVYRAIDLRSGHRCAVRIFRTSFEHVTDLHVLFYHEARIAAALHHPHILRINEIGEWRGHGYIISEYMAEGSLPLWLRRTSPSLLTLLDLARQAALALVYAHRFNVVHGDLRPASLLLTNDIRYRSGLRLVVSGFALGRLSSEVLAIGGMTPSRYLAPERREGAAPSPAADVFAFGQILSDLFIATVPDPDIAQLCAACTTLDPAARPPATTIALDLALRMHGSRA
ncbi:MAG: hypothetical protein C0184_14220 [Chloroflexus aggregans]|uniref:Protein kinase domain-containing protein n=1 Tax=Chloroflexus aggregans TaxID=152260 RepID=A0A2J6WW36_9CHLR|nr:MAG: hypothetical protein C0184_14220 [Chloroflexus aggregans]